MPPIISRSIKVTSQTLPVPRRFFLAATALLAVAAGLVLVFLLVVAAGVELPVSVLPLAARRDFLAKFFFLVDMFFFFDIN